MKGVKHVKIFSRLLLSAGSGASVFVLLVLIISAPEMLRIDTRAYSAPADPPKSFDRFLYSSAVKGAKMSIEFRDADSGKVIYSHGGDQQLIPASNMKILTIAAAMTLLRPEYKYRTEVWVDELPKKGIVAGNLYLKGYGDPSLVDEQLWTLARDVAYRGIIEIKGKIVAVDAVNSAYAFQLYEMLRQKGLNKGDYEIKPVGGTGARLEAMINDRTVVAAMLNPPFSIRAQKEGLKSVDTAANALGA